MSRRTVLWISVTAAALLLLCSGGVFWYAWQQDDGPPIEPAGIARPLTLDGVETQTRLDLPDGTELLYGTFYVETDWAVAVQARFDRATLPNFLAVNGLPPPVDGLRPVPALAPMPPPPVPSTPASDAPSVPGAPPASDAPSPDATPSPAGPLLRDAPDWHPERAVTASGISRHVRNGVARWVMFDLDDQQTVTIYVYAVAEVPLSSRAPSPTPSAVRTS